MSSELEDVEEYARKRRHFYDDVVPPRLADRLARSGAKTVLDAGCGDGSLVRALLAHGHVQGRKLFARDLSETRIKNLEGLELDAAVDDVQELATIPDGSIDFLISTQVIEHVDDAKMLAAIARVTHPGSLIYLSTVWKTFYAWYFFRNETGWVLDPTHIREYRTDGELLDKVDSNVFRLRENVKTPIAWPATDFLIRRLGGSHDIYARSRLLRAARGVKVPIPGYRNWELVLERR